MVHSAELNNEGLSTPILIKSVHSFQSNI